MFPGSVSLKSAVGASGSTATSRVGIYAISIGAGAGDTAQSLLELQRLYASLEGSCLVGAKLIKYLLCTGSDSGVGGRRVVGHVKLHAIYAALCGAAAVSKLSRQAICILQVLIADLAYGIISLTSDSSLAIGQTAYAGLKLVKAVSVAQISLCDGIAVAIAPAAKAAAKQGKKQDPGKPRVTRTAHTAISYGSDIRQSVITIHCFSPFLYL